MNNTITNSSIEVKTNNHYNAILPDGRNFSVSKIVTTGAVIASTILCTSVVMLPLIPVAALALFTKRHPIDQIWSKYVSKKCAIDNGASHKSNLIYMAWLLVIAALFQTEYVVPFYSTVFVFIAYSANAIFKGTYRISILDWVFASFFKLFVKDKQSGELA